MAFRRTYEKDGHLPESMEITGIDVNVHLMMMTRLLDKDWDHAQMIHDFPASYPIYTALVKKFNKR